MARAKGTTPATPAGDEWETVGGSLGIEHDFSTGPLVGSYLGGTDVKTDKVKGGIATAHKFAADDDPESIIFVWESADLRNAFGADGIQQGDRVRIVYLGEREFSAVNEDTGKNEPRRIKQYRVQRAKS
jgi:hypothetical protein